MGHHRLATPDLGRIFGEKRVLGLSEWQLLERYLRTARRGCVRGAGGPARAHGPGRLPPDAGRPDRRRRRVSGDVSRPRPPGAAARSARRDRAVALWRGHAGGAAGPVAKRPGGADSSPDHAELDGAIDDPIGAADREIGEVLDQELSRLPSKYRHPIVLCYLEGQTHEEAARQLKWPIGTVKGRLARARDLLQSRLVRRGLAPAVGRVVVSPCRPNHRAALHRELLDRTVKHRSSSPPVRPPAQIVSASITSLVEGVLTSMFLNTFKWAGVAVLVVRACLHRRRRDGPTGRQGQGRRPPTVSKSLANARPKIRPPEAARREVAAPKTDRTGQRLAKIEDLRKELVKAAAMEWDEASADS